MCPINCISRFSLYKTVNYDVYYFTVGAFDGLIGTVAQGAIALVLWYGGKLVFEKELSAGILTCKSTTQY